MKKTVINTFLFASLLFSSCSSGYDTPKNLELMKVTDEKYTTDQQEYGLDLLIKLQKSDIKILEEELARTKEDVEMNMAYCAGMIVLGNIKSNDTELYRAKKDEILAKEQEIEKLQEELKTAKKNAAKELGLEEKDELIIDHARSSFYQVGEKY